jgi:trehalose 6-phosphate phosphatase
MHPGLLVEEKPVGVALHYRNAPEAEAICHDAAQRLARSTGMSVQIGKMVVELKGAPGDKGQGLMRFMNEPPFKGTRPVVFGDDLTDEHAFATARVLGGAGVLVGAERPTAATYRLEDVSDLISWLQRACEGLE